MAIDLSQFGGIPAPANPLEGASSSLGAASRGALGMIPVGEQAYAGAMSLGSHRTYLEERKALQDAIRQDIDTQPEARLAGQVAGVALPIAATAGIAAPETLLGAAAQGAGVGGLFGAGKAIDTLAGGGSGAQAAGDVALSTGLGAVGGAAGQGLGSLVGRAAKAVLPSSEELGAEATAGVLGGTARQIRALPGKNPVQTLNAMRDVMNEAKVGGQPLVSMGDRFPDRIEKFIALQKQAGKTIGDTIENAGIEPMDSKPILDQISTSMKFPTPDEKAHLNSVIDMVKSYADDRGKLPFGRLQELKSDLGEEAFKGQGNPVLQGAYHVLTDAQDAELDKAATTINKPAFDQAKKQYQVMSRALPMLKMAVAKELGSKASITVPGAALLTGHPLVAGGALLKNRLGQMASGAAFSMGNMAPKLGNAMAKTPAVAGSMAAASMASAPTDLHLQHPQMAPWKPIFDRNAAQAKDPGEVAKSHAVTDFTLSQRDPAYAKAKQEAADSPLEGAEPRKMADGGVVEELKDKLASTEPVEGFGSTLEGLRNVLEGKATPPAESVLPVRSTEKFHQPFNRQMEEQLRAFLLGTKKSEDE